MRRRLACLALACTLALPIAVPPAPALAVNRRVALARAMGFLHARQYADGGFGEAGRGSSEQLTAWTIVAITSAGQNPNTWKRGRRSPVDYLAARSSRWRLTTDYARTVLAAVAAGRNPHSFGGKDLIAEIKADVHTDGASGDRIGNLVNSHIWSMIALRAAGEDVTVEEIAWLKNRQNADGGWGWAPGAASDSNDTAAAIEALIAAGEDRGSAPVRSALDYLRSKQRSDGGFSYGASPTDSGSTSWAIQALVAAREQIAGRRWTRRGGNPMSRLRAMQAPSGAMRYTASRMQNPLFMTVQAMPALALRAFPVRFSSGLASASSARRTHRPTRRSPMNSSTADVGSAALPRQSTDSSPTTPTGQGPEPTSSPPAGMSATATPIQGGEITATDSWSDAVETGTAGDSDDSNDWSDPARTAVVGMGFFLPTVGAVYLIQRFTGKSTRRPPKSRDRQ